MYGGITPQCVCLLPHVQLQPYLVREPYVEGEEKCNEHACGDGKDPSKDDDDVEDGEDTCGRL